jgi:2-methylisocitrate lyase-like PEP mutase family enzyme
MPPRCGGRVSVPVAWGPGVVVRIWPDGVLLMFQDWGMSGADNVDYQGFRALHVPGRPVVLANAWDAGSARLIEAASVQAVATTSAGIAWSLGLSDGEVVDRATMLGVVRRIARAVEVPVTADIEGGYAETPDGVARTVAEFVDAGVVGINIEDGWHGGAQAQRTVGDQVARIAAARAAGGLFINARIDTFFGGTRDLGDVFERAAAYLEAGADGVFVPGLTDLDTVAAVVAKVGAPVNVMVGAGAPAIRAFAEVGVARVSLGASVAGAAYGFARRIAAEALAKGTYELLAEPVDYGLLQR